MCHCSCSQSLLDNHLLRNERQMKRRQPACAQNPKRTRNHFEARLPEGMDSFGLLLSQADSPLLLTRNPRKELVENLKLEPELRSNFICRD
jgi:hypothetical protein